MSKKVGKNSFLLVTKLTQEIGVIIIMHQIMPHSNPDLVINGIIQ